MTFFYDLNKRLAALAARQDQQLTESAVPAAESKFSKLAKEIGKNPKVKNPGAVAATIGREKYGQKAMTAKSVAGRKHHEELDEKFATPAKVNPAKKGMFAGKTKAELQKQYNRLKATGPHHKGSPEFTKMKELAFAIRAKSGWGKMDEGTCSACGCSPCECVEEGNAFTGKLAHTPKGGKFELDGKTYKDTSDLEEADMVGLGEKKKARPDFLDIDGDGDRKESMKKAAADKKRSSGTAFDPETAKKMFANKDEHPRHDVKDTGYSKRYTRKHEDDMEKDDEVKSDAPKKKGRPKSTKPKGDEHVTKGSYKYKMVNGKRVKKTEEALDTDGVMMTHPSNMSSESVDRNEYDAEGDMAKGDMHTLIRHAKELETHLRDNENLPTWIIEKLGQIKGMMTSVTDYILSQHERGLEKETGEEGIRIAEKITKKTPVGDVISDFVHSDDPKFAGKSKKQRINQALGAYYGMHKGKVKEESTDTRDNRAEKAGKKVTKDLEYDMKHKGKDDAKAERAGKRVTKDIEYDEKVEETTTAGSVATATTGGKSSKGMQFGKGVYEGFNTSVERMISESLDISMNKQIGDGHETQSNISITASGHEADMLKELLKMAGIDVHGHGADAGCPTCGKSDCGCESLEENELDWPTNKETLDAEPNLRTYSGGLNGPKSTGQSTTPVLASQLRRQTSMEESVELERSLFQLYKQFK
jgi:hypothetical protein